MTSPPREGNVSSSPPREGNVSSSPPREGNVSSSSSSSPPPSRGDVPVEIGSEVGDGRPLAPLDDDTVIDLQLQSMAFEAALRYAERVLPRSLLDFLA